MAMRVLYLDVDDEITSAASRIRSTEEIRVAVVLPYGSRIATSRINFRLLARDATLNGKRLSVIAGDAATRALAASAGLPIFGSVAEYESSSEGGGGAPTVEAPVEALGAPDEEGQAPSPATAKRSTRARGSRRKAAEPPAEALWPADAAAAAAGTAGPTADVIDAEPPPFIAPEPRGGSPGERAIRRSPSDIRRQGAPGAGIASSLGSTASVAAPVAPVAPAPPASRTPAMVPAERVMADTPDRPSFTDRRFPPLTERMPIVIGIAVLLLALLVGGVGAYLLLPTASVVITPRQATIGPIQLTVTADPTKTEPDPAAKTVPAQTLPVNVDASQTFPVTGKRVQLKAATGKVRFRNFDFTSTNTIPKGSVVSTQSGIRFSTQRTIMVARAERAGFQIIPSSAIVNITAVQGGPDGNVQPNTITVIPRGEDPLTLDVTNPDATAGGKRDEFPRVAQADLDAASAALRTALTTAFQARLADPSLPAPGTTVFPETGTLGEPEFSVDPATLLGKEVSTFDLGATATGSVLGVDEATVGTVASGDIATHVESGYTLVEGSSTIDPSPGVVDNGVITFPVTITAKEQLALDPNAIETEIRGKTLDEAQSILARYGSAQLTVWPDWVGTIPTLDARVEVKVAGAAAGAAGSGGSASPVASP